MVHTILAGSRPQIKEVNEHQEEYKLQVIYFVQVSCNGQKRTFKPVICRNPNLNIWEVFLFCARRKKKPLTPAIPFGVEGIQN